MLRELGLGRREDDAGPAFGLTGQGETAQMQGRACDDRAAGSAVLGEVDDNSAVTGGVEDLLVGGVDDGDGLVREEDDDLVPVLIGGLLRLDVESDRVVTGVAGGELLDRVAVVHLDPVGRSGGLDGGGWGRRTSRG